MYTLIRSSQISRLLREQAPVIALSIIIAELFYKFHSFTLECLAFLATWFVLEWVAQRIRNILRPINNEEAPGAHP